MLSLISACATAKGVVAHPTFAQLASAITVFPQRFYATSKPSKPAPPAKPSSTVVKGNTVKGTSTAKPAVKGTPIKGAPVAAKAAPKKESIQKKITKAKDKLKTKEKAAKEKEKEKEKLAKQKEQKKVAKEKEKEQAEKQKEKKKADKEKEKEKAAKEKEQKKAKALAAKEKEQAAKQKKQEQAKKIKEKEASQKDKEKEKQKQKLAKEKEAKQQAREKKQKLREEKKLRPKKPLSAFIIYSNEVRPQITAKNPNKKVTEVMKEIGAKWGALSQAEKKKYEDAHEKDKVRFQKQRTEYEKTHTTPPKRPAPAYTLFVKDVYSKIKADNPNLSATQLMKPISIKWKGLTADQKKIYEKNAAASKERYLKEFKAFERAQAK